MENEKWWEEDYCKIASDVNSEWHRESFKKILAESRRRTIEECEEMVKEIAKIESPCKRSSSHDGCGCYEHNEEENDGACFRAALDEVFGRLSSMKSNDE